MRELDTMHGMSEMLDRAKQEAQTELDIPLDHDTCMKQLNYFDADDFEIREGFQMVYQEFKSALL